MNIKSILIGSAAALVAVSGARAADAIVAAEPEPVEYVRVCDAFGTGYFYIPGTETCIRIGGYLRVQLNAGDDASPLRGSSEKSDYDIFARARLRVDAKNDTEYGPLWSRVQIRVRASEGSGDPTRTDLEEGFIELAGFRVGVFYSWWDDDLFSESDWLNNNTIFASARYVYEGEAFSAGLSVDELTWDNDNGDYDDANLGVTGFLSGAFGPVTANLLASYDVDYEEFAIRGMAFAEIGPGTLGLSAIYASGATTYYDAAEWTVAAEYIFNVNEKLRVGPYGQYFWDYKMDDATGDAWLVALTAEYKIVDGLTALATVEYLDEEDGDDFTGGFLRLQRNF